MRLDVHGSHCLSNGYTEHVGTGIGSFSSVCTGNGSRCPGYAGLSVLRSLLRGPVAWTEASLVGAWAGDEGYLCETDGHHAGERPTGVED